jgi:hypothetical protein
MTMTTASLLGRAHDGVVDEPDPAARPRRRSFTAEYNSSGPTAVGIARWTPRRAVHRICYQGRSACPDSHPDMARGRHRPVRRCESTCPCCAAIAQVHRLVSHRDNQAHLTPGRVGTRTPPEWCTCRRYELHPGLPVSGLTQRQTLTVGQSKNVSNLAHDETGSRRNHLLGAELRSRVEDHLSSNADRRQPQACTKTSGTRVRNRPEPLHEINRNPRSEPPRDHRGLVHTRRGGADRRLDRAGTSTEADAI